MSNRVYQAFGFGVGTQPVAIQVSFENMPVFSGTIHTVTPQEYFEDVNREQMIFTWQTPWIRDPTQVDVSENEKNLVVVQVVGGDLVLTYHQSNLFDSPDEFRNLTPNDEKKNFKINGVSQYEPDPDRQIDQGAWWYLVDDGATISYQIDAAVRDKYNRIVNP